MQIAVANGNEKIVTSLIAMGAEITHQANTSEKESLFHTAALNGNTDILEKLLSSEIVFKNKDGHTLDNHKDVNSKSKKGNTCLHLAVLEGHLDTVIFCVDRKADVQIQDNNRNTAVHLAALHNQIEILKYFIIHRYHLKAVQNNNHQTARSLIDKIDNSDFLNWNASLNPTLVPILQTSISISKMQT